MNRRNLLSLLGGAAAAWPVAARAQAAMPVIGFLNAGSPETSVQVVTAYRNGLSEVGYVEGRNVAIEFRWSGERYNSLPALATELVRRQVNVISAGGDPAAQAAKAATSMIPIVFVNGIDPVKTGLVSSLNRPGGNVTGVSNFTGELGPKRLELLRQLVPKATTIAMLSNPRNPDTESEMRDVQSAVLSVRQQFQAVTAGSEHDIDVAFETLARRGVDALLVGPDTFLLNRRDQIVGLAGRYAIPTIYNFADFAAAGGLISYGASRAETWRQMGLYTGRVLKGEKPGDLPVVRPSKFELVINLKTAKALGLSVPASLLALTDEAIE